MYFFQFIQYPSVEVPKGLIPLEEIFLTEVNKKTVYLSFILPLFEISDFFTYSIYGPGYLYHIFIPKFIVTL